MPMQYGLAVICLPLWSRRHLPGNHPHTLWVDHRPDRNETDKRLIAAGFVSHGGLPGLRQDFGEHSQQINANTFRPVRDLGQGFVRRPLLPVGNDALFRVVRQHATEALHVLGLDNWAWNGGHRYATIIRDLGRRRITDILADRKAAAAIACLAARAFEHCHRADQAAADGLGPCSRQASFASTS